MNQSLTLNACAKINLTLSVGKKRADGYHDIESIMQKVSLCDEITVEKTSGGFFLECDNPGLTVDDDNLCLRAARAYFSAAQINAGAHIILRKRIPVSAGLAGGSTDAAAVLKALSHLCPAAVELPALAAQIGADVPFCLFGTTALCEGIGEKLTPIPFNGKENLFAVVAKNCEGLSTSAIYSLFDEKGKNLPRPDTEKMQRALKSGKIYDICAAMANSFEILCEKERPAIAELKNTFLSLGAKGAMMSGSGSAVFALFDEKEKAVFCEQSLKKSGSEAFFCTLL